jgi:hypothetical protein
MAVKKFYGKGPDFNWIFNSVFETEIFKMKNGKNLSTTVTPGPKVCLRVRQKMPFSQNVAIYFNFVH